MKASVIIPTKGRDQCVRQTLEDLSKQTFKDFDIWLVDQNSPPLKELEDHVGDVLFHHEKMEPLGSHAGRNVAIQKTRSEICIFVDDDVRLDGDFVFKHVQMYSEPLHHQYRGIKLAAFAGKVVQPKDGLNEEQMKAQGSPARYNKWLGRVSGNFIGDRAATL
jgi:glycosyltransferase involved in cell wall biosynthesis